MSAPPPQAAVGTLKAWGGGQEKGQEREPEERCLPETGQEDFGNH